MKKLIAIVNVVAWSGFWAFGYLAFSSGGHPDSHLIIAGVLALLGLVVGIIAYRALTRISRESGYDRGPDKNRTAASNRARHEEEV